MENLKFIEQNYKKKKKNSSAFSANFIARSLVSSLFRVDRFVRDTIRAVYNSRERCMRIQRGLAMLDRSRIKGECT